MYMEVLVTEIPGILPITYYIPPSTSLKHWGFAQTIHSSIMELPKTLQACPNKAFANPLFVYSTLHDVFVYVLKH